MAGNYENFFGNKIAFSLKKQVSTDHFKNVRFPSVTLYFSKKAVELIQVSLQSDKNIGHFTWRPTYMLITSRSVLHKMRSISDKSCRENQKFYSENNSNEMQQLLFILRKCFYSTCFGWQSHPSSGVHVLYVATGKQAHLVSIFFRSKVVLSVWVVWSCR